MKYVKLFEQFLNAEYPFIADRNFNKYSGKYNFHYLSADDCLQMFKGFVDEIAIPKSQTTSLV